MVALSIFFTLHCSAMQEQSPLVSLPKDILIHHILSYLTPVEQIRLAALCQKIRTDLRDSLIPIRNKLRTLNTIDINAIIDYIDQNKGFGVFPMHLIREKKFITNCSKDLRVKKIEELCPACLQQLYDKVMIEKIIKEKDSLALELFTNKATIARYELINKVIRPTLTQLSIQDSDYLYSNKMAEDESFILNFIEKLIAFKTENLLLDLAITPLSGNWPLESALVKKILSLVILSISNNNDPHRLINRSAVGELMNLSPKSALKKAFINQLIKDPRRLCTLLSQLTLDNRSKKLITDLALLIDQCPEQEALPILPIIFQAKKKSYKILEILRENSKLFDREFNNLKESHKRKQQSASRQKIIKKQKK